MRFAVFLFVEIIVFKSKDINMTKQIKKRTTKQARRKKKNGRPLKGSVAPFLRCRIFNDYFKSLMTGYLIGDNLRQYRLLHKMLVADRLRVAVKRINCYEILPVEDIIRVLRAIPKYIRIADYVQCVLRYYNDPDLCLVSVVCGSQKSNSAKKDRKGEKKQIQQALADNLESIKELIEPVRVRLHKRPEADNLMLEKYVEIDAGVAFLNKMFSAIYKTKLPQKIEIPVFAAVERLHPGALSAYYVLEKDIYKRTESPKCMAAESVGALVALDLFLGRFLYENGWQEGVLI